MTSVNTSANTYALANLRQINSDLTTTQNRISSGLKVASARDNASVWAAATTIRTEVSKNQAVIDGLGTSKSIADTAAAGLDVIGSALDDLTKLTAAMTASGTATDAQKQLIAGLQNKITAAINGASSGTVNLLTSATAVTATIGYDSAGTALSATYAINVISSDADVTAVTTAGPDLSDATKIGTYATKVANAQKKIALAAANVANFAGSIDAATTFLTKINDIRETAIGSLVDADMEKESAKVQALQVKQQLAYQALSISNASAQNILRLFQ